MSISYPESERAIIAALATVSAVDPGDALETLESLQLRADDFSKPALADVFNACADCLRRSSPIELFVLEAALAPSGAVRAEGGRKFLAPLVTDMGPTQHALVEHARLVRDSGLRRRAIASLRAIAKMLEDPLVDPNQSLAEGATAFGELTNRSVRLNTAEGDTLRFAEMVDASQGGRREMVIPSGIAAIDDAIGGLQPAHLTLIGALPGVGKSSLLATILRNVANSGRKVGLFSLEDERLWVTKRLISFESKVPLFLLATRPLSEHQLGLVHAAGSAVYDTLKNVVIDDRLGLSAADIAQAARDMVLNHGCKAILVDHLGEVRMGRSERYDLDIGDALAIFRDFAKRYNVPVVVASHVKRRTGMGVTDAPSLTDFANSSAPERMARVALGLSAPVEGCLRVSVLKQTNGRSGQVLDLALVEHAAMVDNLRLAYVPEVKR